MRRGPHIRILSVTAIAATLLVQVWLPVAHAGAISHDCRRPGAEAARFESCGPQLSDPTDVGSAHDSKLCPICLALHCARHTLGTGLVVGAAGLVSCPTPVMPEAELSAPLSAELLCAPRGPPRRTPDLPIT